ncbi:MAG: carboxypeptidase-like regulatory domain-containing protein [Gemmatimonas sp.]
MPNPLNLASLLLLFGMMHVPVYQLAAQPTADVIRGRVTNTENQPVENAQVTAVSFIGGITKTKRTDKNGRFSITYPNGEGDYWVSVVSIGYQGQRFEIRRNADEEVLMADVRLSNAQTLQSITVSASGPRQPPPRVDLTAASTDASGGDTYLPLNAAPPGDAGNLAAMAAQSAGVQLIPGVDGNPDRISILGLDGSQNNTTVNGQLSGLSTLPRDANVVTTLRTGYDVAAGGYSGAQISVVTNPGTNYVARTLSATFNAPQAQFNDRVGRATEFTQLSVGGRVSGPILADKDFYTFSFQLDRRSQILATLSSGSAEVFQSAGVSPDSIARVQTILKKLGVPETSSALGLNSIRTNASFLGGVDWAPKSANSGHAIGISYTGGWTSAGPPGVSTLQVPAALGTSKAFNASAQVRHTNFVGALLTETTLSGGVDQARTKPLVNLPGGSVLVTSMLDDGTTAIRNLTFGGSTAGRTNSGQSFSGRNVLSWFSIDSKHRLKLISELRFERSSAEQTSNILGRYTFQSLQDLENSVTSSFTRSLNATSRNASEVVAGLALGDAWRPVRDIQIQYGMRLDGNRFLDRPSENAKVEQVFGVSNDHVPNGIYASPRLGFSWLYGTSAQIPFAEGFAQGPRATIRGGVGVFQNIRGSDLLSPALLNTGLGESSQQLICTGDAVPTVDWAKFLSENASIPGACRNGASNNSFANTRPNVTLFARTFAPERSVRTNLSWSGAAVRNRFNLYINGTFSYNAHQANFVDLNLKTTPQFALAEEGARPVYVPSTSIDGSSGLTALLDSRVAPEFNSVSELQSGLHSVSRQITIRVSPITFAAPRLGWGLSYNYLSVREQFRGFASTAGDPFEVRSGTGSSPQHDFVYTLNSTWANAVTFAWSGRVTSGARFTPSIAGDVNGDGYRNDRAFIFAPGQSTATDATAAGIQSVIANAPGSVRSCLTAQLGGIAARNSCVGPWSASNTNLRISINPVKVRLPQRTTLSFNVSNPIGAADLLLHGDGRLHGWGQTALIDQSLLYVRGFDNARSRYVYEVNQRFGLTRPSQNSSRTPVVITMMASINFAPTRDWQSLSLELDRGRTRGGVKLSEGEVRQYARSVFQNPMARMLETREQLHLTRLQSDSIATMSRRFTRLVDSVWAPAAKYLAALPKGYDRSKAQARLVQAREIAVGYLIQVAPHIKRMLTKGQTKVLSSSIASMLEPRYLELLKSGQVSVDL